MESNGFENFIGSNTADGDGVPQIPPIWLRDTKLLTLRAAVPQGLLVVTLVMLAVVFKYTSTVFDTQCSNLSVLLFYQAALWLYALGIHHFYEVQHARLRRRGYQAFYKHLRNISSFQFIIISWWNVLTVVYLVGSLTYTVNTICDWNVWYSAINLTVGSICVHGIITLTLIISYSRDVIIFNRSSHYASDIEAIEVWRRDVTSMVHSNVGLSEEVVQLVEKQAYLIEFYQNRIKDMSAWLALRTEDRQSRHPN